MKIVTVVPIAKSVLHDSLTYFTNQEVEKGAVLLVPLRKKNVPALVLDSRAVAAEKMDIKRADFKLKPAKSVLTGSFLHPDFLKAAKEVSEYFAAPYGAAVKEFVPQFAFEAKAAARRKDFGGGGYSKRHEVAIAQIPAADRMLRYKSIIREEFAKGRSVYVMFPALGRMEECASLLEKGIEDYTFIFHNNITEKKVKEQWLKVLRTNHPVLVIGTKSFISIPRGDISTLIVEEESSAHYKSKLRPYIDARVAGEVIGKHLKWKVILGDTVLRTESYYREKTGEFSSPAAFTNRLVSEAEQIMVNMGEKEKKAKSAGDDFQVLSDELKSMLRESRDRNEHVLLFVNRRGYGTALVCHDCYRTLLCESCSSPLITHKDKEEDALICHKCRQKKPIPALCPYCQSWNMKLFGIGVQRVEQEVKKLLPGFPCFRFDGDAIKTRKQGEETMARYVNSPGSVIVATEAVLSFLTRPVDRAAVVSMDAMFAFPDFAMRERIFRLLTELRLLAKKTFLIQTKFAEEPVFDFVLKGNLSGFYKGEIEDRKMFGYPPFKTLIKITALGKDKDSVKNKSLALKKIFAKWDSFVYPAFIPKVRGTYGIHVLIKADSNKWPGKEPELREALSSLEPSYRVDIMPETLL